MAIEMAMKKARASRRSSIADCVHTGKRKDFWKAYLDWKKGVDLRKLGIGRGFLKSVRNRSPGRDFNW